MRRHRAAAFLILLLLLANCSHREQPFKEWKPTERYRDFYPADARIVAEGTGVLRYTPVDCGQFFLIDMSDMRCGNGVMVARIVVTGRPTAGREIVFDPAMALLTEDGKAPLRLKSVTSGHTYQFRWE